RRDHRELVTQSRAGLGEGSMRLHGRRRRSGYTLFELVLVLAVIVMLAALTYPSLDTMSGGQRLFAASDQVKVGWALAQAHAMEEGRPYRFAIIPGKGNYRIAPDTPDFWGGNGEASADPANPALVLIDTLPKGVVMSFGEATAADAGHETALASEN